MAGRITRLQNQIGQLQGVLAEKNEAIRRYQDALTKAGAESELAAAKIKQLEERSDTLKAELHAAQASTAAIANGALDSMSKAAAH